MTATNLVQRFEAFLPEMRRKDGLVQCLVNIKHRWESQLTVFLNDEQVWNVPRLSRRRRSVRRPRGGNG